jgi:hypothetical protein
VSQRLAIARVLPPLVLAVVAAAYVWMSYDYDVASQAMPWMAGVLALALIVIDGPWRLRRDSGPLESPVRRAHSIKREAVALGWIGAFIGLVVVLGFLPSILFYVFCYLRVYAGRGARISAATALGLVGFLYLLFEVFMGYEIFGGLIVGDNM